MLDFATRIQPAAAGVWSAQVPFDLVLAPPTAARAFGYTTLVTADTLPAAGVQMLRAYALGLEDTLATAVLLSLFCDARAGDDDALPHGQDDRRGWLGDELLPPTQAGGQAVAWGSLLWLLRATKVTDDVLPRAQLYAQEALAWMLRDGVASRVDVAAQWVGPRANRLAVRPTIWAVGQDSPVYDVLWGTSLQRWGQA